MTDGTATPFVAKDPKLRPMLPPRPGRRLDQFPFDDPRFRRLRAVAAVLAS